MLRGMQTESRKAEEARQEHENKRPKPLYEMIGHMKQKTVTVEEVGFGDMFTKN
ncbi:MAG: hypothetical protein OEW15_18570 [Nitrospirota bacterium]|nr:hypothetical protein [Nitrospirota bacterium]